MKKLLLMAMVALIAMATLFVVGCGPSSTGPEATDDSASANEAQTNASKAEANSSEAEANTSEAKSNASTPQFEVLPSEAGRCMVSDDQYLYFIGDTKLYRANLDLSNVVVLDDLDSYHAVSLCLADGKIYYATDKNSGSEMDLERPAFEIRCIDTDGQNMEVVNTSENLVYSLSMCNGSLVFGDYDVLKIVEPTLDSTWDEIKFEDRYPYYVLTVDDAIYLITAETNYNNPELYVYRQNESEPSMPKLADVDCCDAFAVSGEDVYYLVKSKEKAEDSFDVNYDLMKVDAQGNVSACGVSGVFAEDGFVRLCPYGDYIIYSKFERSDDDPSGKYVPYCYNTISGEEAIIPGYDDANNYTMISDVAGGYAFIKDVSVGNAGNHVFLSLTDPTVCKTFESVVENADESIVQQRQEEEEAAAEQAAAEAAAAEEKAYADEPYGPGTSALYLSADELSACYRLVRLDGTTEFMVLLAPGETTVQYFPCGRYRLKTAEGEEWISDEEAFGPKGHYDTTDIFTFEDGGAYEIGSGTRGDFHGEDQEGFLS